MKNKIFTVSLILILTVLVSVFFIKYVNQKSNFDDPIIAIPTNASIIYKSKNWNSSWKELEKSDLWLTITKSDKWKELRSNINNLKNLIKSQYFLTQIENNQNLYISIHDSADDFEFLLSTSANNIELLDLLDTSKFQIKYKIRLYDNIKIYEFNNINFCIHKNILFFSSSYFLVENSIRQLNNNLSLLNNDSFRKLQLTESKFSNNHIYINYKKLHKLIKENYKINYNKTLLNNWAEWTELDIKVNKNNILFSGLTLLKDSSNNYLSTLINQTPQLILIDKILPSNTESFSVIGISDYKNYYEKYKSFLSKKNNLYKHEKWVDKINEKYNISIENVFISMIENEIGHVNTNSKTNNGKGENYIVLKSPKESLQILDFLNKKTSDDLFNESYRNFNIKKLNISEIISKMLGPLFHSVDENYYCWIDGYLIFANSPTELKTFINNIIAKKTLSNNIYYQNFYENISLKCNFLYYSNPGKKLLNNKSNETLKSWINFNDWKNLNAFSYQIISNNKELFFNNIIINYEPFLKDENKLIWSINLGETSSMKPSFVTNHYSRIKEIAIQDDANNLHLINSKGEILWKKKIGSKINSEIKQIDFYKNNKLQMLFNTSDSLYLLDRLGNYVEGFPRKLTFRTKEGLTLFDYDKNKNYRILIPSENNIIYNYDKTGEIVNGWEFKKMENAINNSIYHYVKNNKDYIYIIDNKGNVRIVGRNGKTRKKIGKIPFNNEFYLNKKNGEIYTSDKTGNIWVTDFNGNSNIINTFNKSSNFNFIAHDINNDEITEIIISDNKLNCFQLEKKIFENNINSDIKPMTFNFKNEILLGLKESQNIFLINFNGEIKYGPIYGEGYFNCSDIENDGELNIIVSSGSLIYNYSLK